MKTIWCRIWNAKAVLEGWAIFNFDTRTGAGEIQRDDDSTHFKTDADAVAHCIAKARRGSTIHLAACLAHLTNINRKEQT